MPPQEFMEWFLNYEVIFQEEEVERGIENFSFFWHLLCFHVTLSFLLFYHNGICPTIYDCNSLDLQTIYVY